MIDQAKAAFAKIAAWFKPAKPKKRSKYIGHGGARAGAGRPYTQLDEQLLLWNLARGVSQRQIARDFGVGQGVICNAVRRLNKPVKALKVL